MVGGGGCNFGIVFGFRFSLMLLSFSLYDFLFLKIVIKGLRMFEELEVLL